MPIRVEIYGADGIAVGQVEGTGHLREILEAGTELVIDDAAWHPIDGSPPRSVGRLTVDDDDILLAVADEIEDGPVHAQWHDVSLDVGPYRLTGQMPTMPGFDPGRALARPTGEFVLLRDVQVVLAADQDGDSVGHRAVLVNRYVVDRVSADMMLGFFFPGAHMTVTGGHDRFAAGAAASAAARDEAVGPPPADGAGVAPGVIPTA